MTKFCVVNKEGIGKTGPYAIFDGWLFDSVEQAQAAMDKDSYFRSKHSGKYVIAKVEYED